MSPLYTAQFRYGRRPQGFIWGSPDTHKMQFVRVLVKNLRRRRDAWARVSVGHGPQERVVWQRGTKR